jgi:hypothetical protein
MKTNTDCSWMVKLKDVNDNISLHQELVGFPIARDIKIEYFMNFKALKGDV